MKKLSAIVLAVLMAGCIGTSKNPMISHKANNKPLWWQLDTAGVKKSQSPWEKFVPAVKANRWDDPWANFQEPELFPKDWKKRFPKVKPKKKKKKRVDKKLNRPIILQQGKDVY